MLSIVEEDMTKNKTPRNGSTPPKGKPTPKQVKTHIPGKKARVNNG